MRDPLRKRHLRDLKKQFPRYLVIFLLLFLSIGFTSGFLVADGSMIKAYNESFTKYRIEDGHFRSAYKLNRSQLKRIEEAGVQVYELFYKEEELPEGRTLRIYKDRKDVDLVCLMEGRLPERREEIAVDRMFAENNGFQIGDVLSAAERDYTICGLVALSDYSALFSDNNDTMFDALYFGVGVVSEEAFDYPEDTLCYEYAFTYSDPPQDETEEKTMSDDFLKVLNAEIRIEEYIPRYLNQAIRFTGEDMGSDKQMMEVLLIIIVLITAFVFALTTSDTIAQESAVIGTLRASGYSQGELLRHYMTMPFLVTLFSAIAGNIGGYTVFKDLCAGLYYASYSLPTYETVFSGEAMLETTLIPLLIMVLVTFLILRSKLKISPLRFLHNDLRSGRRHGVIPLSEKIPFFSCYRTRILFANRGNYLSIFVGFLFANLLLMFGMGLPMLLDAYQENMEMNLLSTYQYVLKMPVSLQQDDHKLEGLLEGVGFLRDTETSNIDAEKFSAYELELIPELGFRQENVSFYGVEEDSRYIQGLEGRTLISSALAEKYELSAGDTLTLKERYEDTVHEIPVEGVYDYSGALCIFMPREELNRTFDLPEDTFLGYFSNTPITDIPQSRIASVIELDDLTKVSRQLDISFGAMMVYVDVFAVLIFLILTYLISKVIIEKSAVSISMVKILGYTDREVSSLYLRSTTTAVIVSLLLTTLIDRYALEYVYNYLIARRMSGWIPFVIKPQIYPLMFLLGVTAYAVVALIEYHRIRKVRLSEALKNVE
ncbi:MAG: ABC transporter permease [Erysipelotrichaceae bacterium]|nr:ABC transporter permease [Erysipelotrichaceae bacterium]